MTTDDRTAFEDHKRAMCLALGRDQAVFTQTVEALLAVDAYDYTYLWSFLGLPIIQHPADVMATQEVIWATKPDVIIETGVARGGSVIFMAAMLQLIGKGKVIAVGKGRVEKDGKVTPLDVKAGDTVLFGKYAGQEIKIDGGEYLIIREEEVLGVIEK